MMFIRQVRWLGVLLHGPLVNVNRLVEAARLVVPLVHSHARQGESFVYQLPASSGR